MQRQRCSALTNLTSQKSGRVQVSRCETAAIKTDVQSRFLAVKHCSRQSCTATTHISSLQRQRKSLTVVFCICVHRKQWKESRKETDTFTDWTNTCWHILHAVPRAGRELLISMIFINSDNIWGILSSFLVFWLRHTGVSGQFTSISLFFLPCVSFSFPSLPSLHLPHRSSPDLSSSYPSLLPLLPHPERRSFTEGQTEPDSSSDSLFPSSRSVDKPADLWPLAPGPEVILTWLCGFIFVLRWMCSKVPYLTGINREHEELYWTLLCRNQRIHL